MTEHKHQYLDFFHILVIGSSGHDNDPIKGQLPIPENILSFMAENPTKQVYLYFIDPRHNTVNIDQLFFHAYETVDIPFSMIPRTFQFATFFEEYKIGDEEALFIDYSNMATSEYDFVTHFGAKNNWHYFCPGCSGPRLDLSDAYKRAKAIPHYSIYDAQPVPATLPRAYREDINRELGSLLTYTRLLPTSSNDPRPPPWLIAEIGTDEATWMLMRESSRHILSNFLTVNGSENHHDMAVDKWGVLINEAIFGI